MNATATMTTAVKSNEAGQREVLGQQLAAALGAQQDPFRAPRSFFFDGAQRRHVLESLRHLTAFGDLVLVVTGEHGSGKTTLLQELLRIEKEQLRLIALTADEVSNARELSAALIRKADLHPIDGEPPVKALARFIANSGSQPKARVLVVVDDAERAPLVVLEFLLSQFVKANRAEAPVLLLSGTSELIQKVRLIHAELQQLGWLHQLQLKSLTADESKAYILARLKAVGAALPDAMTPRLDTLVAMGKGNFGRINRLAAGVLLDRFSEPTEVAPRRPLPYAISAVVAVVLLVASYVLVTAWQNAPESPADEALPVLEVPVPRTVTPFAFPKAPVAVMPSPFRDEAPSVSATDELPPVEDVAPPASDAATSPEAPPADVVAAVDVPADRIAPEPVVADAVATVGVVAAPQAEPAVDAPVVGAPAPIAEKKPSVPVANASPATAQPPDIKPIKAKPVEVRSAESAPSRAASQTTSQWIASRPADHLTLQLMGSSTRDGAEAFARQYANKLSIRVVESTLKGKPWFVVITGDYVDRSAAQQAVTELPASLRKQNPWIRSFKGLQE